MKKIFALLLAVCIILSLSACSGGEPLTSPSQTDVVSQAGTDDITGLLCSTKWQIIEKSPVSEDRYVTTYTFFDNGSCVFFYGYYFSDVLDGGTGSFTVNGDTVNITLFHQYGDITTSVDYKTAASGTDIVLTQISDEGLFNFHENGTVLNMEPYSEEFKPE